MRNLRIVCISIVSSLFLLLVANAAFFSLAVNNRFSLWMLLLVPVVNGWLIHWLVSSIKVFAGLARESPAPTEITLPQATAVEGQWLTVCDECRQPLSVFKPPQHLQTDDKVYYYCLNQSCSRWHKPFYRLPAENRRWWNIF
jgi:hypothetical protein